MKILILILISIVFTSCGDLFLRRTNITGKYYIFKSESSLHNSLFFRIENGDYIGRIDKEINEYYYTDSFLVTKTIVHNINYYYIINMKKDSDFAAEKDYLIGPLNEKEFSNNWKVRLSIQGFEKVK